MIKNILKIILKWYYVDIILFFLKLYIFNIDLIEQGFSISFKVIKKSILVLIIRDLQLIQDVVIIKDGIPLFSKSFCDSQGSQKGIFSSQKGIFSQGNNLIMISGFFSALNSFGDQFKDLGTIKELQLSKNDLKLSFLKDSSIPNLLYLATFDEKSKGINIQRYLRKISHTFLKKYNINEILNWSGRVDAFKSFEEIIKKYVEEEKKETEIQFKEKVVRLFNDVKEKINENEDIVKNDAYSNLKIEEIKRAQIPHYFNLIPSLKVSKKINPKNYLTGVSSFKVFNQINGINSIDQIAKELSMNQERVYAICKSLIKMGFISLFKN